MKLLYLELENFLSYYKEIFRFHGNIITALSGDNGAGKSAILDAITWVLFGIARGTDKGGKGDDKLLCDNLPKSTPKIMRVRLIFNIEGETYYIERYHDFSKRTSQKVVINRIITDKIDLNPELCLEEGETLTVKELKENNKIIVNKILGMNYDAFTTSCFFLQNKYDSILQVTPKQRKEILFEILGLNQFDRLKEKAKEYRIETTTGFKNLKGELLEGEKKLQHEKELIEKTSTLGKKIEDIKAELTKERQEYSKMDNRLKELQEEHKRTANISQEITNLTKQLTDTSNELENDEKILKRYNDLINQKEKIKSAYLTSSSEKARFNILGTNKLEKAMTENELIRLDSKIDQLKEDYEEKKQSYQGALNAPKNLKEYQKKLEIQKNQIKELEDQKNGLAPTETKIEIIKDEINQVKVENEFYIQTTQKNQDRLKLLQDESAKCPTCGTLLDKLKKEELIRSLKEFLKNSPNSIDQNRKKIEKKQNQYKKLIEKRNSKIAKIDDEIRKNLREIESIDFWIQQYQLIEREIEKREQLLKQFEEKQVPVLQESEEKRRKLSSSLEKIDFNEDEYETLKKREVKWENEFAKYRELEKSQENKKNILQLIELLNNKSQDLERQINKKQEKIKNLDRISAEIEDLKPLLSSKEEIIAKIEREQLERLTELAQAKNELEQITQIKKNLKEQRKQLQSLNVLQMNYTELEKMFGRDGIPSLILENSIPEMENETQRILDHLTEGEMSIRIITQKKLKTKQKKREVFDIQIRKRKRIREAEMLSGGERYKLNFAFRLALSHILTRRAGKKLQTLIIDEGFGSQDQKGRENLLEILKRLQTWFESIIVISHIEEIKNQFPQQLLIKFTEEFGSKISEIS